jgi:hypothetical protein
MRNGKVSRRRPWLQVRLPLTLAFGTIGMVGCMPADPAETGTGGAGSGSGGAVAGSGGTPPSGSGGAPQGSGGAPQGSGGAAQGSGGRPGSGGAASGGSGGMSGGTGGRSNTGGTSGGSGGRSGGTSGGTGGTSGGTGGSTGTLAKFSFFVASVDALKNLSNNAQGFGGDLRFGETGDGAGLKGADKICTTIAEGSMAGSGAKGWRAFLSAPAAGSMPIVNAIERIGNGPWYDRQGRLFSASKANLIGFRPSDTDPSIKNDFPNEHGIPNHTDGAPGCTGNACPDNHDTLTGSNDQGKLYGGARNPTCDGWTNKTGSAGLPRVGHSWPRMANASNTCSGGGGIPGGGGGGTVANAGCYGHWMSSLDEAGCAPGINLVEMGAPNPNNPTVGSGGGYGGIYCFALMP